MNHNIVNYAEMVEALAKRGEDIQAGLTPGKSHLLHMAVGVSGESGELLDAIKKHTIYGKELDVSNVIEELGDLEFYLEGMRQYLDITREAVLQVNIAKLSARYTSGKYSDVAAIKRADKNA